MTKTFIDLNRELKCMLCENAPTCQFEYHSEQCDTFETVASDEFIESWNRLCEHFECNERW